MPLRSRLSRLAIRVSLGLATLALLLSAASANTPKRGTVMGPADESKTITVTVWLNMHNKPALDSLVEQMYDSTSPNFHHFLTMKEFKEQFAPSAEDAAAVSKFLKANNMTVTSTDKNNHFVVSQVKVGFARKVSPRENGSPLGDPFLFYPQPTCGTLRRLIRRSFP